MRSLILAALIALPTAAHGYDIKAVTDCKTAPSMDGRLATDASANAYMMELMRACPQAANKILTGMIIDAALIKAMWNQLDKAPTPRTVCRTIPDPLFGGRGPLGSFDTICD